MKKTKRSSMAMIGVLLCLLNSLCKCKEIETPDYKVTHLESEFEIRLYTRSSWMSASIPHLTFAKATRIGYHRLFQYIEGANLNSSRIPMTIPVLTGIAPQPKTRHPSADFVRFYLPANFRADPPTPLPELNLEPHSQGDRFVAVRAFSGFARDWNVGDEAEKLVASLVRSPWANCSALESGFAYSIAQYSSPFKFTERLNEVWIDLDERGIEGCGSSAKAAY